ncbi:adenosine deaminase [Caldibacillus thermoamylovorans]|uniref:adenine deaminase C-terminal domain-containing protein n=1 Tax=Caldibacillus thermoamylovorans TaxID=35841 RepID=UPI000D559176|nr:adenine deaminase C-terminal domain-containing protein [Caldibacillus thermoamylovorans]AWI11322.1 adenosine deaminase [Caldibacillus thermoamylovorans]MDL0419360.1 adenine deaminase C-terminal domain-containing protein [Caldibacillus thermoamylovorans]
MVESKYRWRNRELREHVEVLDGKRSPTKVFFNATYLHGILKQWMTGNIWIYQDRIVYVGEREPDFIDSKCEQVDCKHYFLVPGYIEPHVHPFQLYNPLSFAQYALKFGTSVLINDNLPLILLLNKKKAFSFIEARQTVPSTLYWWARYDSQSELIDEERIFSNALVKNWINHEFVIQGGELTGWPKLLAGDDLTLHWIQETKRLNKKVEGHFPGASEKTLAKLKLLGADSDHEAMTGEEVMRRLLQGYMVTLRYSSIRPDLPNLLDDLNRMGIQNYDHFMLTTDGSPPSFYEQGVIDCLIKIAIEKGVPPIDAYLMATYNPAKYYQFDHLHGLIATGRTADINFLEKIDQPTPVSVLAKGVWVKRDSKPVENEQNISLDHFGFQPLQIDWDLTMTDLQFSMPFGIQLENSVITKPYSISIDVDRDEIDDPQDECFFMTVDEKGTQRINTLLKGFARIGGLASSFTYTGDILLIGKNKQDMLIAFNRMKEIGGGIVVVEKGEIIYELDLPLSGISSRLSFERLIIKEKEFKKIMKEKGYQFDDPIYTLLFFTSTHLPYIRMTPKGVYDVMQKKVLFPSILR